MSTVSIEEAKFREKRINDMYPVIMPEWLADHESMNDWERPRFASMEMWLDKGDILFDVGAETGHISAVYASFVGAENMVMFEGNPDNWQNIKATWDLMKLPAPRMTVNALVGAKTQFAMDNDAPIRSYGWPECAKTDRIWRLRSYRYIHEHLRNTTMVSIDHICQVTNTIPDAITIDVEGAEFEVLRGATDTIASNDVLVWVSVHPDLMLAHYKSTVGEIHACMAGFGYEEEYLGTDHEIHLLYRKRP